MKRAVIALFLALAALGLLISLALESRSLPVEAHVAQYTIAGDLERFDQDFRALVDTLQAAFESRAVDILVLDEALNDFAQLDPKMCKAVTSRFFSGLSPDEAAAVAGISRRTLDRKWQATLAWLHRRIT